MEKIVEKYAGVKPYRSVPTETWTNRLHLNENLFGPSPKCLEALKTLKWKDLAYYDNKAEDFLEKQLSNNLSIHTSKLFIHNGSAEIIRSIIDLFCEKGEKMLLPKPCWSYYKSVADVRGIKCVNYPVLRLSKTYAQGLALLDCMVEVEKPQIVVIITPHMPTGFRTPEKGITTLAGRYPNTLFLIDEAYYGFCKKEYNVDQITSKYDNIIFTRTFSKFYGLANMRIGYCISSPSLKRILELDQPLFRPSIASRVAAFEALKDTSYYEKMKLNSIKIRNWFHSKLDKIPGVIAYKSSSNFIFIKFPKGMDVSKLKEDCAKANLYIRLFEDNGTIFARVNIAPKPILKIFLEKVKKDILEH